jgi:hypothetical protein
MHLGRCARRHRAGPLRAAGACRHGVGLGLHAPRWHADMAARRRLSRLTGRTAGWTVKWRCGGVLARLAGSGGTRTWGAMLDVASMSYCSSRGCGSCPPRCLRQPLRPSLAVVCLPWPSLFCGALSPARTKLALAASPGARLGAGPCGILLSRALRQLLGGVVYAFTHGQPVVTWPTRFGGWRVLGGPRRVLVGVPNGHRGRWTQMARTDSEMAEGNVFDAKMASLEIRI